MRSWMTIGCLALALAACKGEEKKVTGGSAQGEILPGSASDAMLPLDTVKSQAPLAPKTDGGDKAEGRSDKDAAKPVGPKTSPKAAATVETADAPAAADEGGQ